MYEKESEPGKGNCFALRRRTNRIECKMKYKCDNIREEIEDFGRFKWLIEFDRQLRYESERRSLCKQLFSEEWWARARFRL